MTGKTLETHPNSELATEAGLAIAGFIGTDSAPKDAIEAYEALRETLRDQQAALGLGRACGSPL